MNILDKYWEILKVHGLFADQSREPFQWSNAINSPVHVQRRQYHLILRKMETDDDLQHWRRFVAEYRTLEGYDEKKDGLVPGLGVGVGLLVGLEIKKRMCGWT